MCSLSPVISLAQSAALNLIEHRSKVNAVAPGVVDGEHWDGVIAIFVRYEGKAPIRMSRSCRECRKFAPLALAVWPSAGKLRVPGLIHQRSTARPK